MSAQQLQKVIHAIDAINARDPRTISVDGSPKPYELAYSEWLTDWVKRLDPSASEELLIAARGQHIRRWEIPRESHPDDRKGYLLWRETLKGLHAEQTGKIMREAGYPDSSIEKTQRIILKKNIRDPDSQIVEDALCLVFLEKQFTDLREKEPEENMIEILRKTWRKMGEKGRAEALKIQLAEPERLLLQKALG